MLKVRVVQNRIPGALKKKQAELTKVPAKAFNFFRSITPIDTGNARRKTRLQGSTIKANYPYAVPLDKGHSKQAPQGMVRPTLTYIAKLVNNIMRTK